MNIYDPEEFVCVCVRVSFADLFVCFVCLFVCLFVSAALT